MGKFRKAVKWAYVMQGTDQGLNALFTFLLAMLLGPKDFGAVAMAMAYILFTKMLLEQGLVPALIQRKDLRKEHLDSAFCLNLGLSLVLVGFSIYLSHWWASVNHLPILGPLIAVLSLVIPLEGLTIVQRAVLQREMDFKSFSVRSIVANIIGGGIGLGMALRGYGVWALVGKQLTTDLVSLIVLWKLSHWRPRLHFSLPAVKELWGFSANSFAGNLGLWLNTQIDTLLVGLFFGPVAVGLYRLAVKFPAMIVASATSSLQAAAFPEFCRLQDDKEKLRKSVLSCLRVSAVLTIPALVGLAVISRPLMAAFGPAWVQGSNALVILCILAMLQPLSYFVGPLLQAVSHPRYLAILEWGHALASAGFLVLAGVLLKYQPDQIQVTGVAITRFLTSGILLAPFIFWAMRKFAGIRLQAILRVGMPSFLAAGVMGVVVYMTSTSAFTRSLKPWIGIALDVFVGFIVASGVLLWLDKELRRTISGFLSSFTRPRFSSWPSNASVPVPPDPSAEL